MDTTAVPILDRAQALADELADALAPYSEQLTELADELTDLIDDPALPELPDRPHAEEPGVDTADLLYDSRRHWLDQLAVFKRGRVGTGPEKSRARPGATIGRPKGSKNRRKSPP